MSPVSSLIRCRQGTATVWNAADPVLALGELGVETDTGRIKAGDGVKTWSSLTYVDAAALAAATAAGQTATAAVPLTQRGAAEGVATLDASIHVPMAQILTNVPDGLPILDENGQVPESLLSVKPPFMLPADGSLASDIITPYNADWTITSQKCLRAGRAISVSFWAIYYGVTPIGISAGSNSLIRVGTIVDPRWWPIQVGPLTVEAPSGRPGTHFGAGYPGVIDISDAAVYVEPPAGSGSIASGQYFVCNGTWMAYLPDYA